MKVIAIYPGRFQPFHLGHKSVYDVLVRQFGVENVYIATSDKVDPPRSPFNFAEKQQIIAATGVDRNRVVQTRDPYKAIEITSQYDPRDTKLLFAVSAKDMAEDPRFKSWTKRDGSPAYFQPAPNKVSEMEDFDRHGYIFVVPTLDFKVDGKPMRSATEFRKEFAAADDATKASMTRGILGTDDPSLVKLLASRITEGKKMKLNDVVNETTAGAIGSVVAPLGVTQRRKVKEVDSNKKPTPGDVLDHARRAREHTGQKPIKEYKDTPPTDGELLLLMRKYRMAKVTGKPVASVMRQSDIYKLVDAEKSGRLEKLKYQTTVEDKNPAQQNAVFEDEAVRKLQQDLIAKGAKITADGNMGPATQAAMKQFGMTAPATGATPTATGATPTATRPGTDKQLASVVQVGPGFNIVKTIDGETHRRTGTRPWRNNNPGNISYGGYATSQGSIGTDGRYAIFPTAEMGMAACKNLLFGPSSKYINLSMRDAINRYAPSHENDTVRYIQDVTKITGTTPDTLLKDLTTDAAKDEFLKAIFKVEGFYTKGKIEIVPGAVPASPATAQQPAVSESSQRVDRLVTRSLKIMRGGSTADAVAALKTVLGEMEYNERPQFYDFFIKQMVDMYSKQGVTEGGPFSYGAKKPRKGSIAANAEQKRKEQDKGKQPIEPRDQMVGNAKVTKDVKEEWSQKYKNSINCSHPKGFSQKAHCAGKRKHTESTVMEMVCPDCGMCKSHGTLSEIRKGQPDSNGNTKCWPGKHAEGTKKGKNGGQVRNCVPNEGITGAVAGGVIGAAAGKTPGAAITGAKLGSMVQDMASNSSVSENFHDSVTFEIDNENAFNHVMGRFNSRIDWDGEYLVAPRRYWGAIQELAHEAGGAANEISDEHSMAEDMRTKADFRREIDDTVADFLARGGEIETVPPNRVRVKPGQSLASKHIGSKRETGRIVGKDRRVHGNKPVVNVSEVNDYFKRRKDEEDRIAGTKPPVKRTPQQTDYQKRRNREQQVGEAKRKPSAQERFNNRLKTKHGIDLDAMEKQWAERTKKIEAEIAALREKEKQVSESYYQTNEDWKSALAGAALAGAAALGSGGAQAADLSHYNTEYLQKAADENRVGRYMVNIDDAKAELQARANGKQQAVSQPSTPQPSAAQQARADYIKKLPQVDSVERNGEQVSVTHDGKEYQGTVLQPDDPRPRFGPGTVQAKVAAAQLGFRGLGTYVVYFVNDRAYIEMR
jgi:hypothetical protein